MKRFLTVLCCGMLVISADLLARGSSSSVSRSSSRSSYSRPSTPRPAPTPVVKPAPAPVTSTRQSSSAIVGAAAVGGAAVGASAVAATSPDPKATTTTSKPAAVAPSAITQAQQKADAMGTKAYSSQTQAQTAADQKTAAAQQTKFNNYYDKEPATRPSYIPNNINRNGTNYTVVYSNHGYGYYDNTGAWMMLAAADAMMDAQRYNNYVATQPMLQTVPVRHHAPYGLFIFLFFLVVFGVVLIIVLHNYRNK